MLFVDGENFTIRGQNKAAELNQSLKEGPYFKKDFFLWMPNPRPLHRSFSGDSDYGPLVDRVKSLGKLVWVWFFERKEDGLGPELKLSADTLIPLEALFTNNLPK